MAKNEPIEPEESKAAEERMRVLSRRGFVWAGVAIAGTYGFFHWLHEQHPFGYKTPAEDGVTWPFRDALTFDDRVTSLLYAPRRLSPTYSDSAITEARVNGDIGLGDATDDSSDSADTSDSGAPPVDKKVKANSDQTPNGADSSDSADFGFDPKSWTLLLEGQANSKIKSLKIEDIKALPKHEFVTEFKCIEGWSYFMKWAGARLSDFIAKYPPAMPADYVALETPDGQYYVSIDMPAAMHPQTLLAYEMNGDPLELEHGAPLRLIIPHKYGVKNLKRIGKLAYSAKPPKDYWAEQGYDYYAGL